MEFTDREKADLYLRLAEYGMTLTLSMIAMAALFAAVMAISWLCGGDPDFSSILFVPEMYCTLFPIVAAAIWWRWRLDTIRLRQTFCNDYE